MGFPSIVDFSLKKKQKHKHLTKENSNKKKYVDIVASIVIFNFVAREAIFS